MLSVTNSCEGSSAIPTLRERDASCLNVNTVSHGTPLTKTTSS